MAIKSIEVKNFTVFENFKCEFSPSINLFIGENGTGKTHLLKLLYAAAIRHAGNELPLLTRLFGNNFRIEGLQTFQINDNPPEMLGGSIFAGFTDANGNIASSMPDASIKVMLDTNCPPAFIPAKEFLSMAELTRVADEYKKKLGIDMTILDIIEKAKKLMPDKLSPFAQKIANKLEDEFGGEVFFDEKDETFWVYKHDGTKVPFTSEAEGYKKLGLLWQLVMNRSIKENMVLFWDEPDANLNPKLMPVVVEILVEMARNGVQIFLATHDYNLMKYFGIKKQDADQVCFHGFYKTEDGSVKCDTKSDYQLLKHNPIIEANIQLLEDIYNDEP